MSRALSHSEAEEILTDTQRIEQEKAARREERLERKRLRELKKKRAFQEKLVAPILLFTTLIVSIILFIISRLQS
ncbi:MAG: hypothetical protein M3Q81_03300 [bacterium]|nr:hypothetical protein [bacterium]